MVRTTHSLLNYNVTVKGFSDQGETLISAIADRAASDAFDYADQAVKYFRFAIQEMDVREIEVEVTQTTINYGARSIESIEITRD